MDQDFDINALMEVCATWPETKIPERVASDFLMERTRQALNSLNLVSRVKATYDLIPLIRQVLLRVTIDGGDVPYLRVPTGEGWPTIEDWTQGQFDVLPNMSSLNIQPRWPRLNYLGLQTDLFDDVFTMVKSRLQYEVPSDPLLSESMGLPTYTGQGQREAVRALFQLPQGSVLIANLPTGSGKSLLAHLPPLIEQEGQMTLAIVPTVALAIDQASRMKKLLQRRFPNREFASLAFHGGLSSEERAEVHRSLKRGEQPILFTSPEFALGSLRGSLEHSSANKRLNRVFIDEAHLVIGWGNGFRPAFQLLPALVRMLSKLRMSNVNVVLASATLTSSTINDLRHLFGPPDRVHVVSAVHLRPEIRYASLLCSEVERRRYVLDAVRLSPRPFILYVTRPDEANSWYGHLRSDGFTRLGVFTGETNSHTRESLLRQWSANELDGMIATSAFGLGVDKSDVRTIIHATLPESLDRYYQEVGRAGRDGFAGAALLLHTEPDVIQAKRLALPKLLGDENAYERWEGMLGSAVKHETLDGVLWVDLTQIPSHLTVRSGWSQAWSVRLLTLMARAGLIELVAMGSSQGDEDSPLNLAEATRAAIRILDELHRNPEHFASSMARARKDVRSAGKRGFQAMTDVAYQSLEISDALRQMYTVNAPLWITVSACCGGCPMHWKDRAQTRHYHEPIAARLGYFSPRKLKRFDQLQLHRAGTNIQVVTVSRDERIGDVCGNLLAALAPLLEYHTVYWGSDFENVHGSLIVKRIPLNNRNKTFFDRLDYSSSSFLSAGYDEVRISIWMEPCTTDIWNYLMISQAQLEVLIVPTDAIHPHNSARKMIDTTPHESATDLLRKVNS